MIRPSDTVLLYGAGTLLLLVVSLATALWLEHTLHAATKTSLKAEQATVKAAERERDAALASEQSTAASWQLSHLELKAQLQACQQQWRDVQSGSAAALQDAIAARQAAELEATAWRRKWDQRSQQCGAALLDAERACPEIEDY